MGIRGCGPAVWICLSCIFLGEDVADEVLGHVLFFDGGKPSPAPLEDDGIDLEITFWSSCAQHREFLRLNQVFKHQTASGVLVHAAPCPCHCFGKPSVELCLSGLADGFCGPVVGGGVAVGVENLGLEVAKEALGV